ncbi:MAG: 4Fe-4S binding protein [Firmicutes bacterium]|nr:4Fe-4S binding protein [Bacillota bacterium]
MAKVKLDPGRCKGCYLCVDVCPKGVLIPSTELGAKGFEIVHLDETKECIGCGRCFTMCPDYCIEIIEE